MRPLMLLGFMTRFNEKHSIGSTSHLTKAATGEPRNWQVPQLTMFHVGIYHVLRLVSESVPESVTE